MSQGWESFEANVLHHFPELNSSHCGKLSIISPPPQEEVLCMSEIFFFLQKYFKRDPIVYSLFQLELSIMVPWNMYKVIKFATP